MSNMLPKGPVTFTVAFSDNPDGSLRAEIEWDNEEYTEAEALDVLILVALSTPEEESTE